MYKNLRGIYAGVVDIFQIKSDRLLQNVNNTSFKEAWERELDSEISDEMWENCAKNIHDSSINARDNLIQFKEVHRLLFSPSILQSVIPMCYHSGAPCLSFSPRPLIVHVI